MKIVLIIISLTLLLKPVFPVLEYLVNYDYIATELCENKAKPELNCNGKCHLMKQLAKASDIETNRSTEKKSTTPPSELVFFQEIETLSFFFCSWFSKSKTMYSYANNYSHLHTDCIFHPPIKIMG